MAPLVCQVCGLLHLLRLGARQLRAAGEELVMFDGSGWRTSGKTQKRGRTLLLHRLPAQRLPDAAHQLPGRSGL